MICDAEVLAKSATSAIKLVTLRVRAPRKQNAVIVAMNSVTSRRSVHKLTIPLVISATSLVTGRVIAQRLLTIEMLATFRAISATAQVTFPRTVRIQRRHATVAARAAI